MPQLTAQLYSLAVEHGTPLYNFAAEHADKLTPAVIVALAPATILVYLVSLAFYRLWLHPLASVPGPFWSKITFLAEFKHSMQMYKRIEEWHVKYGPIVRINPDEVHIDDSLNIETFDQCHRVGTKWSKPESFYGKFRGDNVTAFTFGSNAMHRTRRAAIHPIFSRKTVAGLEHFVQKIVLNLVDIMRANATVKDTPFNAHRGFRCVALDTITSYTLGESSNILNSPDLGQAFIDTVRGHLEAFWLFRALPLPLVYTITHLPPFLAQRLDTSRGILPKIRQDCLNTIARVKKDPDFRGAHGGKTAFHDIIWANEAAPDESVVPEELDEYERRWLIAARKETSKNMIAGGNKFMMPEIGMTEEMGSFVVAGVDSTGTTMEITLLCILQNKDVRARLLKDINAAFPGGVETHTWQGLERVPYMAACIKEGLRLANGVIGRLPRTLEEDNFSFKGYKLPKGTIVSQSTRQHHRHPELFTDPTSYKPERWIADTDHKLDKYLNPFGKGSRSCVGRELAMCEVYLAIAAVICAFPDMKVAESSGFQTLEEVPWADNFLTYYALGNPGLQVVV